MRIDSYSLNMASAYESSQTSLTRVTQKGEMIHTKSMNHDLQQLSLSAQANVQTQRGSVEIALSSSLFHEERYTMETLVHQSAIDPLVINLQGELPSVEDTKSFSFDLNSDGKKEAIALLKSGNGFLALDANENGKIDDGRELFGTTSGNGFADLALFDEDKNGVIDENDAVFDQLRIWQKSALDEGLMSLKQARVGALLLENVSSLFEYKHEGINNASLRNSSLALFDDGKASWISHIDFYVPQESEAPSDSAQSEATRTLTRNLPFLQPSSSASNTHEALVEMLEKRLHILEAKLAKTHDKEQKQALQLQILTLSQNIASLQGI